MKNVLLFVAVAALFQACKPTIAPKETPDGTFYGQQFNVVDSTQTIQEGIATLQNGSLKEVMSIEKEIVKGLALKLEGTASGVCKAKGCWMNVYSEGGMDTTFVRFKDYGFFMPMDIVGKKVIINGNIYKTIVSVEDQRHYAEDEGASPEAIAAITSPKEEYNIYATGVFVPSGKNSTSSKSGN